MNLHRRSFLNLTDFTPAEIAGLLDLAAELKAAKKEGREVPRLSGKNIALIFEKTSTRTRCAFEVAARDQGAGVTYLEPTGSQIGKKKHKRHGARVGQDVRCGGISRIQPKNGGRIGALFGRAGV